MDPKWAAKHIADLIQQSKKTVVFTGAGMSTESGLPDFRSNGGLWDGKDPIKVSHIDRLKDPDDRYDLAMFYRNRITDALAHAPNRGHEILAEWETQGKIWGIATQNIDGYHQRAGNKNVCELHGNLGLRCSFCEKEYPQEVYTKASMRADWICQDEADVYSEPMKCGGFIRPNVVLFGEDLPQKPFHRALQHFSDANLCIILGSSCSVYPANTLPQHTVTNGGQVVIINRTQTDLDYLSSYKINDWSITKALEKINKLIQE